MLNFTRWMLILAWLLFAGETLAQKPYRLPDLGENFKDRIIWGSQAESPDGFALAFGGQDQVSDDGIGHTRIREKGGEWNAIKLQEGNALGEQVSDLRDLIAQTSRVNATLRRAYFAGVNDKESQDVLKQQEEVVRRLQDKFREFEMESERIVVAKGEYDARYAATRDNRLIVAVSWPVLTQDLSLKQFRMIQGTVRMLEEIVDLLGEEPPPRALSPIVHEPKSGLFFVVGGDHFDYLTNDIWAFDPKENRWSIRIPEKAPRPRANHTLKATGDGKIVMTGGYTYSSNTDYCGGQYIDLDDGEWVYDVENNAWTGDGEMVDSMSRTYREGPFHPEFYYEPKPDREAHEKLLAELPTNHWVKMDPPKLPRLNRDWGSAVLDPDRDLILRYSGGHSAHGGTDVLHYHIATNRWELCFPVEFPLGQLYANTRYPNGFNFNGRPWITGHTYQNYGYEPNLKKMLFSGREEYTYIYDVDRGDWDGRFKKPGGMIYNSCFYTLTHCATPDGLVCWTKGGHLFRFDAKAMTWKQLETKGEELSDAIVDNSTLVYDSKRERLLFFAKGYGRERIYDGQIHAYDLKSGNVTQLSPAGMEAANAVPYLCQIRYDEANDLLLVGGTLPPDDNGLRRTPAYDPAKNEWISLKFTGDDPSGERGRNVSLGMMYEPKRKLFLAVDTNSQVYALRLEPASADRQALTD